MRRLRGRRLHPGPESWLPGDCDGYRCPSPPSPPDYQPAPAPAPASDAQISWWPFSPEPCPPYTAPSPPPVPTAGWNRRDQGRSGGYSPPAVGTGGGDDHRRLLIKYALIAAAAIAFVSLILLGVSVLVRRRQVRRRRRQALLSAPAATPAPPTDAADDPDGGGGGGVVHHVWYIRTVGLDEAAIDSIATTRYRAGAGLLGAADCTVCLGEFQDGDLVRLLPKCGHAFHVPCIDTWLRAHVNCPLCRSDVLDPAVVTTTDAGVRGEPSSTPPPADPVDDSNAAAAQADATSEATPADHEQEEESDHPEASPLSEPEQQEQPSLPERPCPMPHNVRRAASMDAAIVSAAALERLPPEAAPEEEQIGRPKQDAGPPCAKPSGSLGIPRMFFTRHCRARSSVLPL